MQGPAGQRARSSQVACFGQDTTQLRSRPGKRSWRAEVPASDANKADGAAALQWFYASFPLAALALDQVEEQHQTYLKGFTQLRARPEQKVVAAVSRCQAPWAGKGHQHEHHWQASSACAVASRVHGPQPGSPCSFLGRGHRTQKRHLVFGSRSPSQKTERPKKGRFSGF